MTAVAQSSILSFFDSLTDNYYISVICISMPSDVIGTGVRQLTKGVMSLFHVESVCGEIMRSSG